MKTDQDQRDAMLEAQVEAALGGHDIGPFEEVDNGYQAACRRCDMTSWVGADGVRYSLLEDTCPGAETAATGEFAGSGGLVYFSGPGLFRVESFWPCCKAIVSGGASSVSRLGTMGTSVC